MRLFTKPGLVIIWYTAATTHVISQHGFHSYLKLLSERREKWSTNSQTINSLICSLKQVVILACVALLICLNLFIHYWWPSSLMFTVAPDGGYQLAWLFYSLLPKLKTPRWVLSSCLILSPITWLRNKHHLSG